METNLATLRVCCTGVLPEGGCAMDGATSFLCQLLPQFPVRFFTK